MSTNNLGGDHALAPHNWWGHLIRFQVALVEARLGEAQAGARSAFPHSQTVGEIIGIEEGLGSLDFNLLIPVLDLQRPALNGLGVALEGGGNQLLVGGRRQDLLGLLLKLGEVLAQFEWVGFGATYRRKESCWTSKAVCCAS